MAYWDTSCLLKLYTPEPDSNLFKARALAGGRIATSEIARLELFAALNRKEAANQLQPGAARRAISVYDSDVAHGSIYATEMTSAVIAHFESLVEQCCRQSQPIMIRTLDAIHLSTAAILNEREIVTTDNRMRVAAMYLGMHVYPRH